VLLQGLRWHECGLGCMKVLHGRPCLHGKPCLHGEPWLHGRPWLHQHRLLGVLRLLEVHGKPWLHWKPWLPGRHCLCWQHVHLMPACGGHGALVRWRWHLLLHARQVCTGTGWIR